VEKIGEQGEHGETRGKPWWNDGTEMNRTWN
jgi:hypothetical protein